MSDKQTFIDEINKGYTFKRDALILGGAMLDHECIPGLHIKLPLEMLNRHGLISGATGTGKTKSLQVMAEQLSKNGVPVLLMDIKGDLSGLGAESPGHPKIDERHESIGLPFEARNYSLEFLSLSEEKGARLRATVSEFGPVLFSKILGLNDTQSGIISVLFKYCDDNRYPLLDLKDFKKALQYITNEGKEPFKKEYGSVSTVSVGAILRKIVELEQQGADTFFGEKSFDVDDLCRYNDLGEGIISVIRLTDIQDRPKLFSTFMLQLLAEIYANFPEEGDLDRPKLVLFIDEAHLVFEEASKTLLTQLESIVKLIRSKGVGIYFVTQNPTDIPDDVLGQLGLKIQHALRAFTAKDRKAIKLAAENYPETKYYEVNKLITEMGIGEAMVTVLNEKGIPTPLVHTMMRAPQSRMDVLNKKEINSIIKESKIITRYNEVIDRESAYELLQAKIEEAATEAHQIKMEEQKAKASKSRKKQKSTLEKVMNSTTTRQIGRTIARELTRGLLGVLGIKTTARKRRKKKSTWW